MEIDSPAVISMAIVTDICSVARAWIIILFQCVSLCVRDKCCLYVKLHVKLVYPCILCVCWSRAKMYQALPPLIVGVKGHAYNFERERESLGLWLLCLPYLQNSWYIRRVRAWNKEQVHHTDVASNGDSFDQIPKGIGYILNLHTHSLYMYHIHSLSRFLHNKLFHFPVARDLNGTHPLQSGHSYNCKSQNGHDYYVD